MTAKEMMQNIGKLGIMDVQPGLKIEVRITDVRKHWDRVDYLIEPLAGAGEAWVSASRVEVV